MRKSSRHIGPAPPPPPFAALSDTDRDVLQSWLPVAREAGIDDVRDLAPRRWPLAITGAVLGMFTRGDDYAVWLAVEQAGQWVVADCTDGSVSPPLDRLEDALAIIHHACDASERASEWA
jgi:hypothetical protein